MSAIATALRRPWAIVPARGVPRLEVVREPARAHTLAYAFAIIAVLAAAVFGAVALNAVGADASVRARELDLTIAASERAYADLVVRVAALEDPARLRERAVAMGMVPAGAARHVLLERPLPADGAMSSTDGEVLVGDPLKPILSVEP